MINPTSADAKELIDLAERMGIPPDDAIRRVVRQLTEQPRPPARVRRADGAQAAAPGPVVVSVDE